LISTKKANIAKPAFASRTCNENATQQNLTAPGGIAIQSAFHKQGSVGVYL
jgi:hypothetical protein